ncbi:MAG: PorT family protein [Flavobacteriaceae bacterium]|nr:PorT family protein [Flavobacteriaceae bacterium]
MRKKTLLFGFLTFLITVNINGQNSTEFGIKAGANYAQYTPDFKVGGNDFVDYKRKLGFYVGGFVNIEIADKIKVQPELLFAIQGTSVLIEDVQVTDSDGFFTTVSDYESNINESTISIPVVVQYLFNDKFYMEGGPQFGYIIDRKEKIKKDPFEEFGGIDDPNSDFDYDKFDLGLSFGFGYRLTENLGINTRYFFGLIERNNTIKSSVLNLGIEYKL